MAYSIGKAKRGNMILIRLHNLDSQSREAAIRVGPGAYNPKAVGTK